jgi:hypothetical protein
VCLNARGALKETWAETLQEKNNGLVLIFSSALGATFPASFAAKLFCRRKNKELAGDKNSSALLEKVLAHEKQGNIHLYLLLRTECAEETASFFLCESSTKTRNSHFRGRSALGCSCFLSAIFVVLLTFMD